MNISNQELITDYLIFYQHSPQSQKMRKTSLNYFFEPKYFGYNGHIFNISTKILKDYFVWLKNLNTINLTTRKNKWNILTSFLNYTMENYDSFLVKIPSKTISWRGSNGKYFNKKIIATIEEIQAILNYYRLHNTKLYLIFRTFAETGMRKGELINAKLDELYLDERYIKTKGKTDNVVYYISESQAKLLRMYYTKRIKINCKSNALFITNRLEQYGPRAFNLNLKYVLNKLKINKKITCQVFRRTLNTLRKKMGCSNEDRKILLNHKIQDVNVEHYIILNRDEYLNLFDTYNPYKNLF